MKTRNDYQEERGKSETAASEIIDRAHLDYEVIFGEVLCIAPGLQPLVDHVRKVLPPQWNEWKVLFPLVRLGHESAWTRLFDMYLRVVIGQTLHYHKKGAIDLEDAIQEGALGLMKAIERFDFTQYENWGHYLPWWIRQYIERAVADKGRMIRLPVHLIEKMHAAERGEEVLPAKEGVTDEPISFEEFAQTEDDGFVSYELADAGDETIYEQLENDAFCGTLDVVLSQLKEREEQVLRMRFGIGTDERNSLEEIGAMLGVTRERIRQIEASALKKLRLPHLSQQLRGFIDPDAYSAVRQAGASSAKRINRSGRSSKTDLRKFRVALVKSFADGNAIFEPYIYFDTPEKALDVIRFAKKKAYLSGEFRLTRKIAVLEAWNDELSVWRKQKYT